MHLALFAYDCAFFSAGRSIAASMEMIAITISNSINVKSLQYDSFTVLRYDGKTAGWQVLKLEYFFPDFQLEISLAIAIPPGVMSCFSCIMNSPQN